MKRFLSLLSLAQVLLLLACNFQMPNAIQIKGSPDLRFSARFDMGDYLKDFFNEDDFKQKAKDIVLLDCEKTSVVTYLVYMKLFDQVLTLPSFITSSAGDFTTPSDVYLVPTSVSGYEKLEVPALDFGEFLDGFSFNQGSINSNNQGSINSKLYVSGSPIVNCLTVELKINGGSPMSKEVNQASGLNGKTTYDKTALPEGGVPVDLPFNGDEVTIDYRIFIKAGKTIKKEWMTNPSVFVELAVWLPFEFTATKKGGAELGLPGDLFGEGDLFGRESPGSDNTVAEMLESLNFAIMMNTNPFTGVSLIVKSKGIEIRNPIRGALLEFAIDEQKMKEINKPENFPFAPQIKLVFNEGGRLSFPRNFVITDIAFKAKLNYTMDLSGGIN
jgi:hypothetical protein